MPIPTDHLADQIQQTNERLAKAIEHLSAELREQNERLTDAIHDVSRDLGIFRADVAREFGVLRADVAREFGVFRADVARELSAIQTSLAWAKWIATIVVVPTVLGLVAWSYKAADRAARIEESIVALRDHARDQDQRIAKLIELRENVAPK